MTRQAGAVPIRFRNGKPQFLIITNTSRRRWIMPKGIIEDGMTPQTTAVKEAFEEAGVEGRVLARPLGTYRYKKSNDTCSVTLFFLQVMKVHKTWDEDGIRKRRWVGWKTFLETVDERIPRTLLEKIPKTIRTKPNPNQKAEKQ